VPPEGDYPIPAGFPFEPRLDAKNPKTPGARVVSQRTGPYKVPAGGEFATFEKNVKAAMPCPGKPCWLTAAFATIEYADGTEANFNTGPWLHHFVVSSSGFPPQVDTGDVKSPTPTIGSAPPPKPETCGNGYIPNINGTWGNGNERTVSRFNGDGTLKYGTSLKGTEQYAMILEVMNEAEVEREIFVRVDYEVLEGELTVGYKEAGGINLDVAGCAKPDLPPQHGKYTLVSPKWISKQTATLMYSTGHMHDGGVNMTIYKNNVPVCTSEMLYDRTPYFRSPASGHHGQFAHISDSGACKNFAEIVPGDVLHAVAHYDADKYPMMLHEGMPHSMMGTALVFAGVHD